MRDLFVRPFRESDRAVLQKGIDTFRDAELEVPHDFVAPQVETAVVVKGSDINSGTPIFSLTGTIAIILDPALKVPGYKAEDYLGALFKAEAILTYLAQKELGAVDAYIAIPEGADEQGKLAAERYIGLVQKCGYTETIQHCRVFRRPLAKIERVTEKVTDESQELEIQPHSNS